MSIKERLIKALRGVPLTAQNLCSVIQRCPICGRAPVIKQGLATVMDTELTVENYILECCGRRIGSVSRSYTIQTWNLYVLRYVLRQKHE